jgi:hypothetical protein
MWPRRTPRLTHEQALSARPVRLAEAKLETLENGGARLKLPIRQSKWGGWLFRLPDGAMRTFEFDAIGLFVWECCDGRTTVKQMIHKLSKKHDLNLREAEVSLVAFLQVLLKKGLIGIPMEKRPRP